jgi:DnaJ-class molecular chaperone
MATGGRDNQGFDEGLSETRPRVKRGENVHTALELKPFEADEGTRRLVRYEADVRCDGCMGRGIVGGSDPDCKVCGGTGMILAERRTQLVVPPGVQDCAQLRVSGDGHYGGWGSIPGDLLVNVRVLPEPRDSRVVATLVVYVVSH